MISPMITRMISHMKTSMIGTGGDVAIQSLYFWLQAGQSLAIGTTDASNPVVHTTALPNANSYIGIPPTSLGTNPANAASVASLIPYVETSRETNGWAGLNLLINELNDGSQWVFANHAAGGATITDLSPPSTMFDNGEFQINAANERGVDLSLPVKIPFLVWNQGESNTATPRETYITDLRSLQDDYIALVLSETGQTGLPFIIEQSGDDSAHDIAKTLYEYTVRYSDAYFSTPKYFLNRLFFSTLADRTHLNANGYMIQGEYEAIAAAKLIKTGSSKAFEPLSYDVIGNTIEVTMNVPTLPIVIDTATLPAAPNYGIKYINSLGNESQQTQVTVSGNKIIIDIGQPAQQGGELDFGRTLSDSGDTGGQQFSCTNLRDSSSIASISGAWTLQHWLPELDYIMLSGDGAISGNGNLWVYDDPTTMNGSEGGSVVTGVNDYQGLEVRDYLVTYDVVATTTSGERFRFRVGDISIFESETGSHSHPITVTSIAAKRMSIVGFDGFAGTISNISVTEV